MYRETFQHGCFTIFYAGGSNPFKLWDTHIQDGQIIRFLDQELKALVVELSGNNVSTTFMSCPKGKKYLGISMPFLVMIVKNLRKYFSFEITIADDTGSRRRFRAANFQSCTQVQPMSTVMPICLEPGWNQIHFNLADFTRRAYKTQFVEVLKVKVNSNISLRRIYFADKIYRDEDLPAEFKLYFPLKNQEKRESMAAEVKEPPAPVEKTDRFQLPPIDKLFDFPLKRQSSTPEQQRSDAVAQQKSEVNYDPVKKTGSQLKVIKASQPYIIFGRSSGEITVKPTDDIPSPIKVPSIGSMPSRGGPFLSERDVRTENGVSKITADVDVENEENKENEANKANEENKENEEYEDNKENEENVDNEENDDVIKE